MIIGPHTVTRGEILPYHEKTTTRQKTIEASDDSVVVIDRPPVKVKQAVLRLPRDEANKIHDYLVNGARFAATPFTLVDGYGTSWTVRLWSKTIDQKIISSDYVEMKFLFRVEVINR